MLEDLELNVSLMMDKSDMGRRLENNALNKPFEESCGIRQ